MIVKKGLLSISLKQKHVKPIKKNLNHNLFGFSKLKKSAFTLKHYKRTFRNLMAIFTIIVLTDIEDRLASPYYG